jgi:hypothetical protein
LLNKVLEGKANGGLFHFFVIDKIPINALFLFAFGLLVLLVQLLLNVVHLLSHTFGHFSDG